ncbi:MAG: hypothetical protein ABEL04_01720, partial [Salinibacter sp.]
MPVAIYNRTASRTKPIGASPLPRRRPCWPAPLLNEVRPALKAIGDPVVQGGGVRSGTKTKPFTNLLRGRLVQADSEALVF